MKNVIYSLVIILLITCFQSAAWSQTFELQRSTVKFVNGGPLLDTLLENLTLTGTLTINGSTVTQDLTGCVNNTTPPNCSTQQVSAQISAVGENNTSVSLQHPDGNVQQIVLLSLEPLITLIDGENFVEVNHWVPAASLSSTSNQTVEMTGDPSMPEVIENGTFGASTAAMLYSLGLIPSP